MEKQSFLISFYLRRNRVTKAGLAPILSRVTVNGHATEIPVSLGISPGIIAFATNNMAVEVNVGVMGISYSHTKQVHNQVTVGKRDASMMNFKVNIFSIGLGMAFYL